MNRQSAVRLKAVEQARFLASRRPFGFEQGQIPTLAEVERQHILLVLLRLDGHKVNTAKALGISLKCLYLKLNAYAEQEGIAS
jgi:DNA-binding NtrC family response regulator